MLTLPRHSKLQCQFKSPSARSRRSIAKAAWTTIEQLESRVLFSTWVDTTDRGAVTQLYLNAQADKGVATGWTGSVAGDNPGTTTAAFQNSVLAYINYFRSMAGVPSMTTLDATDTTDSQAAALMMSANDALNHSPPTSWKDYSAAGDTGAMNSDLSLGADGTSAIDAFIADSDSANTFVGHRRSLLYPQTTTTGIGDVPSNSGGPASTAIYSYTNYSTTLPATRNAYIAWPNAGYIPYEVMPTRWSFAYPNADFSNATVSLTEQGSPISVTQQPVLNGYGENTLVWDVSAPVSHLDTNYDVQISNVVINGKAQSFNYFVTSIDPAPVVTTSPQTQTVAPGQDAKFTSAATGYSSVQWMVSITGGSTFTPLNGATSPTLDLGAATAAEDGNQYEAEYTNSVGSTFTSAATLFVGDTAPQVTSQPSNDTVTAGQTASFTSTAAGDPSPTVQWQISTNKGSTFTNISGATSTTYSFTATLGESSDEYRADFNSTSGTAFSNPATLTVNPAPTAPIVTTNPASESITDGQSATFTAAASGNPAPTVQWQISTNSGSSFTNIAGATSATYKFTVADDENGDEYRAVFTNTQGMATTTDATLTVDDAPTVSQSPSDQSVDTGATAAFTAAASGKPAPTVQWQVSTNSGSTFTSIAGATSTTYSFTATAGEDGNKYQAVFTNSAGSATTSTAKLTIANAATMPVITENPSSQTVADDDTATFTAAASGSPTPTVQWQVSTDGGTDFSDIAGATSTSYRFTVEDDDDVNQYRAVFTNSAGSATTSAAEFRVAESPSIDVNPNDTEVDAGQTATFEAAGDGMPTPTVQWQVSTDGGNSFNNIPDATSYIYSFTATSDEDQNEYQAVYTNTAGSATTTAATLTVDAPAGTPDVTTDPRNDTVTAGDSATFTAAASGDPTPTVQWQLSTDGGSTFTNVEGATSTTYQFTTSEDQNGNEYQAVFTNSAGTATTTAATLTVNSSGVAPLVTTNPQSANVTEGTDVTFTAAASGTPTPTVQWYVSTDSNGTFTAIEGATSTTLDIGPATVAEDDNRYEAVFTNNNNGTATTNVANLNVNAAAATAPVVTTNPIDQTVANGSTATFTAAASGTPTPTVQWQISTNTGSTYNNIAGATSTTYSFTANFGQTGDLFRAVFTNSANSATTKDAQLTVGFSPNITSNPSNDTVNEGSTASFTAEAGGEPAPTVQWQVSTNGGTTFTDVNGASYPTYSFSAVRAEDQNEYRAVFTNAVGSTTSNAAVLTISNLADAPLVTTNPTNQVEANGGTATFTAAASGSPTPAVQWQVSSDGGNTFTNIAGQTSTSLQVTASPFSAANLYRAVFTNSSGSVATSSAAVDVTADTAPAVTSDPSDETVTAGQTAMFTSAASGGPTPTVQWQVSTDGGVDYTNISGATSATYSFTAQLGDNQSFYRAVFTNNTGSDTSAPAILTVNAAAIAPIVTTNPTNQSVDSDDSATFTAAASGSPAPTVQWQVSTDGGSTFSNVAGATSTTLQFTASAAQNGNQYRAVFTNIANSATTTAATLTVTEEIPPTVTTNPSNDSVIAGATASFTAAASGTPTPTVQWEISTDGGSTFTNIDGATSDTYEFTATTGENGYEYRAAFQNDTGGAVTTAATLTVVSAQPEGGSLSGSSSTAASTHNLTQLGTSDWAAFGVGGSAGSTDHKATGGSQISGLTQVGAGTFGAFNDDTGNRSVSWTDGKPLASDKDDVGFAWANNGLGAGYSFTAPADTTSRTLYIYLGGFSSGSTLTAHLSDGSAADYTMSFSNAGKYNELVAITYKAATAGQNLVITYVKTSNINGTNGSADIMAAWIGGAPVAPVATAPVPIVNPKSQSVMVGTDVQFTATATGSPLPTVQWYVSTDGGKTFVGYAGGITGTIDIGPATLADNGNEYEAIFTNSAGMGTTSVATLTVTAAPVNAGSLVGSETAASSSTYNLTQLGTSDWATFGVGGSATGFDHKANVTSQISNVTKVGTGTFGGFNDDTGNRNVSWTDGAPTAKDGDDAGFLWANNGIGAGYSFTAPADTTTRTIYVYLGGYSSGSTLTAHLSDGSAADYTVTMSGSGKYSDIVAITYRAASAGQNLALTYVKSANINGTNGSADLMAAWM